MSDPNAQPEVCAAGERFLAQMKSVEDVEPERDLLLSFGPLEVKSVAHARAVWLCLLAIRRAIALWGLPALETAVEIESALSTIEHWILGKAEPPPGWWVTICHLDETFKTQPVANGENVQAAFVVGALAATARFALYGGAWDGVEALREALGDEWEWRGSAVFAEWLARVALPAAYDLRPLSSEELNPQKGSVAHP